MQIILPFSKKDKYLEGKEINIPIAPLLLDNSHLEKFGEEKFFNLNLTSSEKKSNEDHDMVLSFDSYTGPEIE